MGILKYIALLFLLFLIGSSVYIATQNAKYNVTRSKVLKNPRSTVFTYVNDYRNWETFVEWIKEDKSVKINYPELTMGTGASFTWTSDASSGNVTTFSISENESIVQKMIRNEEEAVISWKLKDTLGGTKVTWTGKGKLDFKSKVIAFFRGGINSYIGDSYQKSLENLNRTLDYEINTYKINVNGIVTRSGGFYLKQFMHCKQKEVDRYIKILVPRMEHFFEKNKIVASGKPFIIYHKYDRTNDDIGFSVCMPIKDSIHIMPGSDIESRELPTYTCLKTTLEGDYSHTQIAWKKAFNYIKDHKLERNRSGQVIEAYVKGRNDSKSPSKWITEIYVPVYPKAIAELAPQIATDSSKISSVTSKKNSR
jgi:effector-binding domain-containing protein